MTKPIQLEINQESVTYVLTIKGKPQENIKHVLQTIEDFIRAAKENGKAKNP